MTYATHRHRVLATLLVSTLLAVGQVTLASTLYVSPDGSSIPPYTNWTSAAQSIAHALVACSNGDVVLVGPGTYELTNTLSVTSAVTVLSTEGPTNTVLNGSYGFPCVYLNNTLATLRGFTVRGGFAQSRFGGGIYIAKGAVDRCLIYNNVSDCGGGGVYAESAESRIDNSAIYDNDVFLPNYYYSPFSGSGGGGIILVRGAMLRGSTICNNSVVSGGSYASFYSPVGGGVLIMGSDYYWYPWDPVSTSLVENCIVYFNYAQGTINNISSQQQYSYPYYASVVRGSCSTPLPAGLGNIAEDPRFESIAARNYRLGGDSPCVDSGVAPSPPFGTNDLSGSPRVVLPSIDMGAYERSELTCRFQQNRRFVVLPDSSGVVFTATVSGTNITSVFYGWDIDGNGTVDYAGSSAVSVTGHYDVVGVYGVTLRVTNSAGETASYENLTAVRVGPSDVYVATNGLAVWPFINWPTAAQSIQAALSVATSGTVIHVNAGTFVTPTSIALSNGVSLLGESISNTIICLDVSSATPVVSTDISDCRIARMTIYGGGSTQSLASSQGGCVLLRGRSSIDMVRLESGRATEGGGLYMSSGTTARNCVIISNAATANGGGVFLANGASIESSTVLDNSAVGRGGGIYLASTGTVLNTIAWNNYADGGENYFAPNADAGFRYSLTTPLPKGVGNIGSLPLISASGLRVPNLLPGSPAIDAGQSQAWMSFASDARGGNRLVGGTVDIGAYEANQQDVALNVVANPPESLAPSQLSLVLFVSGHDTNGLVVSWDVNGDGIPDYVRTNTTQLSVTYEQPTSVTISITASFTNGAVLSHVAEHIALVGASNIYVAPQGAHQLPFTSWTMAATNLFDALSTAVEGSVLFVGAGTYTLTGELRVARAVSVRGLGASVVTFRGGYPNHTNRCLHLTHSNAVVSGVSLVNGYAIGVSPRGYGGGAYVQAGSLVDSVIASNVSDIGRGGGIYMEQGLVSNCTISANRATGSGYSMSYSSCDGSYNGEGLGGGIALAGGAVIGCLISDNFATYFGGGVGIFRTGAVYRCSILGNQAASDGAGVYIMFGGEVDGCRIADNYSEDGASGIKMISGVVRSTLIEGNVGHEAVDSGCGALINCTVTGNKNYRQSGIGGLKISSSSVTARNCIVYGNAYMVAGLNFSLDLGGQTSGVSYSCSPLLSLTNGNFFFDPLFVNSSNRDYRLLANSPCVDAGTNEAWMNMATDIDGGPRIANQYADMGCYEQFGIGSDYDQDGLYTADERSVWHTLFYIADTDGDGVPDGDEVSSGTQPTNSSSFLGLESILDTPDDVSSGITITWQSVMGRRYEVQCATSTVNGLNFITISSLVAMSSSTTSSLPAVPFAIYRVVVLP